MQTLTGEEASHVDSGKGTAEQRASGNIFMEEPTWPVWSMTGIHWRIGREVTCFHSLTVWRIHSCCRKIRSKKVYAKSTELRINNLFLLNIFWKA